MTETDARRGRSVQSAGAGLTLGAGVGVVVGAVIGGSAVVVGLIGGAGVGLVIGAAIDARRSDQVR